jgi:hypothetical protein
VLTARTGQDDRRVDQPGGASVFRKKTRGQVIGAELQEGLTHLGNAAAEAGRAAAEQLAPRVEAAQRAAGPALETAQKAVEAKVATTVAPKVAAAVAAAAPAVATARDTVGPRVEAAYGAAAPKVTTAVAATTAAATKAAADLAPRVEAAQRAAQKALSEDVVPRLTAAQTAALAYAAPRVAAARDVVTPALENALTELEARRHDLVASTNEARKRAKKATAKQRRQLEKQAAKATAKVKRRVGAEPEPRRWPWLVAVLGVAAVVTVLLRRKKSNDDLWPAPTGDGPVPTYREDPVPSSPSSSSDSGKTVSTAQTTAGDATPPDSDLGMQPQQMASPGDEDTNEDTPGASSGSGGSDTLNTRVNEVPGTAEGETEKPE